MIATFLRTMRSHIGTPDGKRTWNHDLFTRVAHEYDKATRWMSLGQDQRWKRRLVAGLPPLAAGRCVDLACGTGDLTIELANKLPRVEIIGVDLTAPMIKIAEARGAPPNVSYVVGDMCRLDLPDASLDLVTGGYALRNAPVLDDALREIRRVLKPGGYAAFLDFIKPVSSARAAFQIGLLRVWCGLISILVHGRPEHTYIAESLRQFPDLETLRTRFRAHGLEVETIEPLMLGMTGILRIRG